MVYGRDMMTDHDDVTTVMMESWNQMTFGYDFLTHPEINLYGILVMHHRRSGYVGH